MVVCCLFRLSSPSSSVHLWSFQLFEKNKIRDKWPKGSREPTAGKKKASTLHPLKNIVAIGRDKHGTSPSARGKHLFGPNNHSLMFSFFHALKNWTVHCYTGSANQYKISSRVQIICEVHILPHPCRINCEPEAVKRWKYILSFHQWYNSSATQGRLRVLFPPLVLVICSGKGMRFLEGNWTEQPIRLLAAMRSLSVSGLKLVTSAATGVTIHFDSLRWSAACSQTLARAVQEQRKSLQRRPMLFAVCRC